MDVNYKRLNVEVDQLVTTGTPSGDTFLAGDGSYQEITTEPFDVVGGRLDLASATSLKWGFQNSAQMRLFNPTSEQWELVTCSSEPTLANTATDLNGTALAVNKIYDVFAEYSSATAFTLVCSKWASYGAGTSARTATWGTSTSYTVGDRVSTGSPLHYYVCVTAHTSHATTFSNDSANWVDNGVAPSNSDFNGLYRHDGVLVSDSSTTGKKRRWLGIIYTYNYNNSGTVNFKDDVNYRFISNFYNKKNKIVSVNMSTSYWSYSTATWRELNNGTGLTRGHMVVCSSCNIKCSGSMNMYNSGTLGWGALGWGWNTSSSPEVQGFFYIGGTIGNVHVPFDATIISAFGFNFLTLLEWSTISMTFNGNAYTRATCIIEG